MFWTDVYVFFTGNEPGITASAKYQTVEGQTFVVGVDITLASLSEFLASLKIGETGRGMIIDGDGRVVAYPRAERVVRHGGSEAITARIDEIGDAPAAAAFDRFRISGPGRATFTLDEKRYLATLSPLTAIGHDWSILIVLPEDDFIGFVAHNNRTGLVMSVAIVGIAVLLAALLFRQGLRGDRAARLARQRTETIARQTAALDRLSDEGDLFDPTQRRLPDALTETIADLTGARRTSLWYFQQDGALLRCADSFDSQASVHAAGLEIQRGELPQFFRHLAEGGEIDVADAASDPRTTELHRLMLAPLGSRALLVLPIRRRKQVVGGLWLEDPVNATGSRHFLRVLASIAALRADDAPGDVQRHDAETGAAIDEPEEVRARSTDLTQRGLDPGTFGNALYPEISVVVIRIDDPSAPADSAREPELIDAIVCAVQELAAEQEIPYLKLVGCDIVGAAGFVAGDQTAAARIANTAIASRDRIFELFQLHGRLPNFRVGIDSGIAIGRAVGAAPGLFNLWGEAVQNARTMAATALPGAIQTSEAAYDRLSHSFLFRPRGTFYLPEVGRAQTFVLAGRL